MKRLEEQKNNNNPFSTIHKLVIQKKLNVENSFKIWKQNGKETRIRVNWALILFHVNYNMQNEKSRIRNYLWRIRRSHYHRIDIQN